MKCPNCAGETPQEKKYCDFCGSELPKPQKVENNNIVQNITYNVNNYNDSQPSVVYTEPKPTVSPKSKKTAFLACLLGGIVGAHQFYAGKTGKGILYLCTAGLFGFGWIIDVFRVAAGSFCDSNGLPIKNN